MKFLKKIRDYLIESASALLNKSVDENCLPAIQDYRDDLADAIEKVWEEGIGLEAKEKAQDRIVSVLIAEAETATAGAARAMGRSKSDSSAVAREVSAAIARLENARATLRGYQEASKEIRDLLAKLHARHDLLLHREMEVEEPMDGLRPLAM